MYMANTIDPGRCTCPSGKTVTSFCKRHGQTLCMDCLLFQHRDCIADVVAIEAIQGSSNSRWNEILTKCDSYQLLFDKQKAKKDEHAREVETIDKELRVTISKMRVEMIKRINQICKNALELSVSIMEQRKSVAKTDAESVEKAIDKIKTIKTTAQKMSHLNENDNNFTSAVQAAEEELAAVEILFEQVKQSKNEVLIQFVVPPIVTDFMEHFYSLGEIIEEVKEDGRTSVYISDTVKKEVHRRTHEERSSNPFKAKKTNAENAKQIFETNENEDTLFVFQKGIYNQDDINLYAHIGVEREVEPSESSEPNTPTRESSFGSIPPLPVKHSPCLMRISSKTPSEDGSIHSFYDHANTEATDVSLRDKTSTADGKPIPKPRTSIGKTPKSPDIVVESPMTDDEFDQHEHSNGLNNVRPKLIKCNSRQSTSSNESNTSLKGARTDSGIIVYLDEHIKPSSVNVSPCHTPVLPKRDQYRFFPGSDLRGSDTAINTKPRETKRYVRPQHSLKASVSTEHFHKERGDHQGNHTYPISWYNQPKETPSTESDIDASTVLNELDNVIDAETPENQGLEGRDELFISPSAIASDSPLCSPKPSTTISTIELQSHKKDIKDVCIITSIVVTEGQLITVCDYSHNCMQLYDRQGNRIQVYGLAKPFGSCLLSANKLAVTSRTRNSVNVFDLDTGLLKFDREQRVGNLVSVFGLAYSNGYICVCCETYLMVFTEDLQPYSSVKAIAGLDAKGTFKGKKKSAKPVFSGVKYCAIDFTDGHNEIFVSDFKQDKVVCISIDGEVKWWLSVKAPKSVALHQGKLYVAAKKEMAIIETGKGNIIRRVHEVVPKYPWSLFVDDATSTMFITNGSINDVESRKIESLPLKILMTILG